MGKTFRRISMVLNDASCNSRGFQRNNMRSQRHSIRNDNRNSDECTYVKHVEKYKFWGKKDKYYDPAPNINGYLNDKSIEEEIYGENTLFNVDGLLPLKWVGGSIIENIKNIIENIKNKIELKDKSAKENINGNHNGLNYLKCSLKQIERRGKAKIFKGHDRSSSFD